jgi:hypothetical protein
MEPFAMVIMVFWGLALWIISGLWGLAKRGRAIAGIRWLLPLQKGLDPYQSYPRKAGGSL